jgi:hypothetical protein
VNEWIGEGAVGKSEAVTALPDFQEPVLGNPGLLAFLPGQRCVLGRAIVSLTSCFRRSASQRLRWQQWVCEKFRDWLWNFSRLWHGLFRMR